MLSFGALNAQSTDDTSFAVFHEVQKEEQEAAALLIYNEAITLEKSDNRELTTEKLLEVLNSELIKEAPESLKEGEVLAEHPALFLKYNVLKKLSINYEKYGNKEKAIKYYLEAAVVDESDVAVWWKLGSLAVETVNMRLARFAFEKGLIYSSNHWPCLDNLISVLYVVGDYTACLEMIAKSFELDEQYTKGFAFRDQIFKEEPHFKKDFMHFSLLFIENENEDEDETKYQECVEEALIIRGKRKLLAKREELPKIKVAKPLSFYSWLSLSEILLQIYTEQIEAKEYQPLSTGIDLSRYYRTPEQQGSLPVPSPDVLAKKYNKSKEKDNTHILKRKKLNLTLAEKDSEPQPKRRSTRVKLSKCKENDVNWNELVYSFLPFNFRPTVAMDADSQDSQESIVTDTTVKEKVQVASSSIEDLKKESVAVSNFINSHAKSYNCITLMEEFILTMTEYWNVKWRHGLGPLFLNIYKKYRKHTCLPNVLCPDVDQKYLTKLAKVILMALELQLDEWLQLKGGSIISPTMSPLKYGTTTTSNQLSLEKGERLKFTSELHYISMLAANNDELILDDTKEYNIRYFYLHGRFMIQENQTYAANALYNCIDALASSSLDSIILHNCQLESLIWKEKVEKIIDSMQQSQSFDELQQIFDEKKYNEIISLLEGTLLYNNLKVTENCKQSERPSQMFILLESFFFTNQYKKCLKCIDVFLKEALSSIQHSAIVEAWKVHLNAVLKRIDSYFTNEKGKLCLSMEYVFNLCDKLVKIMEMSMDADQSDDSITTLPWLLLYRVMKWQEDVSGDSRNENQSEEIDVEENSQTDQEESNESIGENTKLEFMRNAHEYLGKKHWCCHDDGMLLQEFVKDSYEAFIDVKAHHQRETLMKDVEQCFFCLYGNPCKKSKTKSLQEHNVQQIALTWNNSNVLYEFYKPDCLPQLDLKTHTITVEVQHVLRKIVAVVPQKEIEIIPFDALQHYIDGGENFPAFYDQFSSQKKNNMGDLFYYLADFYFKNKEFSKALKFYMHDVCVKPNRFQSWAAMALIRGSRLEEKLNQCELKSDGLVKKLITSTLRCFEKAVNINNKKCLILEEYGGTAYMLNSFASRKLKEVSENEKVDMSLCEHYSTMKEDMLHLSEKCFKNALEVATSKEGEKWLHYYMLGKTAEKLKKPVNVFLDYYQKSLHELYLSGGHFLKKITYRCAPEYTIESVELFYRIHASILKLLKHSKDLDYNLLQEHLRRALKQEIYLEILEADKACLKENEPIVSQSKTTTLGNKNITNENIRVKINLRNPIEQLLNELLVKICSEEESIDRKTSQSNDIDCKVHQSQDKGSVESVVKELVYELIETVTNDGCLETVTGYKQSDCFNKSPKNNDGNSIVTRKLVIESSVMQRKLYVENNFTTAGDKNIEESTITIKADENIKELEESTSTIKADENMKELEESTITIKADENIKERKSVLRSVLRDSDILPVSVAFTEKYENLESPCKNRIASPEDLHHKEPTQGNDITDSQQGLLCNNRPVFLSTPTVLSAPTPNEINSFTNEVRCCESSNGIFDEDVNALMDELITSVEQEVGEKHQNKVAEIVFQRSNKDIEKDVPKSKHIKKDVPKSNTEIIKECIEELLDNVCENLNFKKENKSDVERSRHQITPLSSTKRINYPRDIIVQTSPIIERTFESKFERDTFKEVAEKCLEAFGFCLRRFPEHYKSQYTMAFFLAHSSLFKNLQWSRDLLLGNATEQVKYRIPLPTHGIFSGKKKTNLFQYLWRIPVNEIDRPGSFCTHNYQSIGLLLLVLYKLEDHASLIHVSAFLHKTPDKERKYLRDNDRALLAIKAFDLVLDILKKQMNEIPSKKNTSKFLLEVYEAYKHAQKLQISQQTTEYLLVKAYISIKKFDQDVGTGHTLDEVLKHCQQSKTN